MHLSVASAMPSPSVSAGGGGGGGGGGGVPTWASASALQPDNAVAAVIGSASATSATYPHRATCRMISLLTRSKEGSARTTDPHSQHQFSLSLKGRGHKFIANEPRG